MLPVSTAEAGFASVGAILTALSASTSGGRRLAASATADTAAALLQQLGQFQDEGARAAGRPKSPTPQYMNQFAMFLAQDATGTALAEQLAKDRALQAVKPTQSRETACSEILKGDWSAKVRLVDATAHRHSHARLRTTLTFA